MVTSGAGWCGNGALRWGSEDLASLASSDLQGPRDSRQISSLSHRLVTGKKKELAWKIPKNPFPLKHLPFLRFNSYLQSLYVPFGLFKTNEHPRVNSLITIILVTIIVESLIVSDTVLGTLWTSFHLILKQLRKVSAVFSHFTNEKTKDPKVTCPRSHS